MGKKVEEVKKRRTGKIPNQCIVMQAAYQQDETKRAVEKYKTRQQNKLTVHRVDNVY